MFTYFIPLTVNLTKNFKLEKFVHELNALWKLSESSMGALRELVTVAGMLLGFTNDKLCFLRANFKQELFEQFQSKLLNINSILVQLC
jgi:hypothetical protein